MKRERMRDNKTVMGRNVCKRNKNDCARKIYDPVIMFIVYTRGEKLARSAGGVKESREREQAERTVPFDFLPACSPSLPPPTLPFFLPLCIL